MSTIHRSIGSTIYLAAMILSSLLCIGFFIAGVWTNGHIHQSCLNTGAIFGGTTFVLGMVYPMVMTLKD